MIVDILQQAGFGDGEVNLITNDPANAAEVVESLIAHPAVARINFTGSTGVGKIIAEKAASHLKPVLLELGGKAPLLVLDDADLDAAVDAAIFGAFFNQGRSACPPSVSSWMTRWPTPSSRSWLPGLGLKAGDPRDSANELGT